MISNKIILIGDSVLDNFYWLSNKTQDLKKELLDLGYSVDNNAVDESKLFDVINGTIPKQIYKDTRSYPYPINNNGKVLPLELLSSNSSDDMVVLSIGGNDLRENLMKLMWGVDSFFDSVVTDNYIIAYKNLLVKILNKKSKLLLVCLYIPYIGPDSNYVLLNNFASQLREKWFHFMNVLAKKCNIPLLDLSRTFDCTNRKHYGATEIEPSNLSNKCIADCIDKIYNSYDGYHVYFAPNCDISQFKVEQ